MPRGVAVTCNTCLSKEILILGTTVGAGSIYALLHATLLLDEDTHPRVLQNGMCSKIIHDIADGYPY